MPSLVELIGATLPLRRRGARYIARCPFHGPDKNPSFTIRTGKDGKERWACWSCDAHGDAVDWLMRTRNVDYKEARSMLGQAIAPDPAIIAARRAEEQRQRIIAAFRDRNPDSVCPDWLIAT